MPLAISVVIIMKINVLEQKIIQSNRNSIHNYFGWPTAERLKNGNIAVSSSGFRLEHICPFGKAVMSISSDEGKTFSPPQVIIDTALDDRDAGLCAFGDSGLIVTSFNNTREFQRQHYIGDGYVNAYLDKITDEQEQKFLGSTFRVSFDNGVSFGEVYKSPVTSPHGPIELSDGTIFWVGMEFSGESPTTDLLCVTVNPQNGECKTVSGITSISDTGEKLRLCEPYAFQLPDGTLICHIREETSDRFTTYQSESHDFGKTWTAPHRLLKDKGGAPSHIIRHSSGVLISACGYREKPYGVRVMFSNDDGKTWDTDNVLWADGADDDLGYPSTVELNDGSLFTAFYAHLADDLPAEIIGIKWKMQQ